MPREAIVPLPLTLSLLHAPLKVIYYPQTRQKKHGHGSHRLKTGFWLPKIPRFGRADYGVGAWQITGQANPKKRGVVSMCRRGGEGGDRVRSMLKSRWTVLCSKELPMPTSITPDKGKNKIKLFEERNVRTIWDEQNEKWWFSVVDVVGILSDQPTQRGATLLLGKVKTATKRGGFSTVDKLSTVEIASPGRQDAPHGRCRH